MNNKVVYRHIRKDTGEVFYIGLGAPKRPYSKNSRNKHWHNIVNKSGRDVEILARNLTLEEACELETFLIAEYREMGVKLVNLTDGGEGTVGMKHSSETRMEMSRVRKGKLKTEEHKANLSKVLKGRKHTKKTKSKMSVAAKGKKMDLDLKKLKIKYLNLAKEKVLTLFPNTLKKEYLFVIGILLYMQLWN